MTFSFIFNILIPGLFYSLWVIAISATILYLNQITARSRVAEIEYNLILTIFIILFILAVSIVKFKNAIITVDT